MTKADILNDAIAYYTHNPRSVARSKPADQCHYQHPDDPHIKCAVGRWMKEKYRTTKVLSIDELLDESIALYGEHINDINKLLINKARGHSQRFWETLQELHDRDAYWGDEGLSESGVRFVRDIADKHNIPEDDINVLSTTSDTMPTGKSIFYHVFSRRHGKVLEVKGTLLDALLEAIKKEGLSKQGVQNLLKTDMTTTNAIMDGRISKLSIEELVRLCIDMDIEVKIHAETVYAE